MSFAEPIGFGFITLADRLEALLGRQVDLVRTVTTMWSRAEVPPCGPGW